MAAKGDLLARVRALVQAEGWLREGACVVAAVSGGPDSMALLHLLRELAGEAGVRLVAAHVNHRFRGAESDAEASFVKRICEAWDVDCEVAEIDVPAYIASTGMNPQEAAREKRYAFLRETARRHGARTIALGHHADDQAETVLMRLMRGSGVGGLAGIPMRRAEKELELIRPLLRITKGELLLYDERNGVPYVTDSSNADPHYFRNAIRLEVMPLLERYNPQLRGSLVRLAELASADHDYLEAEAAKALADAASREGEGWSLQCGRFRGLHVALQRRLIKLILDCLAGPRSPQPFEQVEEVSAAIAAEAPAVVRMDVGSGIVLIREYDVAYIGPSRPAQAAFAYRVPEADADVNVTESGLIFRFRRADGPHTSPSDFRREAFFDETDIAWPLVIRNRRPGDRMDPMGLNGSKKVQDMFVDAKIPRSERDQRPLLTDSADRILWIPGLRRSRHAVPGAGAHSVVHVACGPFRPETGAD
ncbi:tRNA lysidine(34) synthetase TilS [Cohnella nanjingensis]|uniref:tRNA(Ile)-lysidine synthase n=1 Tax=Cohnella nanjingensis TaxID=1387779 RepID=A0A7X0RLP3_9BACL|nr:tRNA lysidine(34) synthetase TilS [Cohnella nanjingensis]MBB6669583.1 tRNA lysidine(34) synthetase TilS [Cohnella nanjingensis]